MSTKKIMNIYDVDLTAAMRWSQSLAFATTGISMSPKTAFFASILRISMADFEKIKAKFASKQGEGRGSWEESCRRGCLQSRKQTRRNGGIHRPQQICLGT